MFLHFFVALVEIKHFDVGLGVDLVDGIPQSPSCLIVEVVALDKEAVFTHTANPHFTLVLLFKNDSWGEREREGGRNHTVAHAHVMYMYMYLLSPNNEAIFMRETERKGKREREGGRKEN